MKLEVKNLIFGKTGLREVQSIEILDKKDEGFDFPVTVSGSVNLLTVDDGLLAEFRISPKIILICDRCQEQFNFTESLTFSRFFLFSPSEEDLDSLVIGRDFSIDAWEPIREELLLLIPFERLCKKECKGLCKSCGASLDFSSCSCELHQKNS